MPDATEPASDGMTPPDALKEGERLFERWPFPPTWESQVEFYDEARRVVTALLDALRSQEPPVLLQWLRDRLEAARPLVPRGLEELAGMWAQFAYPTDNEEWPYQDGGLSTLESCAMVLIEAGLLERRAPPKNRMYRLVGPAPTPEGP